MPQSLEEERYAPTGFRNRHHDPDLGTILDALSLSSLWAEPMFEEASNTL